MHWLHNNWRYLTTQLTDGVSLTNLLIATGHFKNWLYSNWRYLTTCLIGGVSLTNLIISICYFKIDSLESAMLISASLTTILSITALTHRYENNKLVVGLLYNIFVLLTYKFVSTNDILTFFIVYELFLLPSAAMIYLFSPNIRGSKTAVFFLAWTQLGSMLVLIAVYFITVRLGIRTFTHSVLIKEEIPKLVQISLIVGFLMKIPTFPFYFWLTKTHVEAVTSFSIFLSGFLVKIALFGLYKFLPIISRDVLVLAMILSLIGATTSSFMFVHQVDLKKVVAYATVQEMGQLTAVLMLVQSTNIRAVSLFLITHTLLSSVYFFINDVLYKNYLTRSTLQLTGLLITAPKLSAIVAVSLALFRGLPFTTKGAVEMSISTVLITTNDHFLLAWLVFIVFVGNITFSYVFLKLLVFAPMKDMVSCDVSKYEFMYLFTTSILLAFLIQILI